MTNNLDRHLDVTKGAKGFIPQGRYYYCTYVKKAVAIQEANEDMTMFLVKVVQNDEKIWVHESTLYNTYNDYMCHRFDTLVEKLEADLVEVKKIREEMFNG